MNIFSHRTGLASIPLNVNIFDEGRRFFTEFHVSITDCPNYPKVAISNAMPQVGVV